MRKNFITLSVVLILFVLLSSFSVLISSFRPPQGYTNADGDNCTACHNTNQLNSNGGSVALTGLPEAGYTPGTAYTFSLTTTHRTADRRRWGFSIVARNSANQQVGTFSSTNANAGINGAELSHQTAVSTGAQSSHTYNNLIWTAPANPGPSDQNITFYFVGNAANGSGTGGDFIYAGTQTITRLQVSPTYTFIGTGSWDEPSNWSNNTPPPPIITGTATIVIDPIGDGECVIDQPKTFGSNVTFIVKEAKKLRIAGDLIVQ